MNIELSVSKVFIGKKFDKGALKAFADIQFSVRNGGKGALTLKGFKLMDGEKGQWLAPPSQKDPEGNYWDTIWFTKDNDDANEFRNYLLAEVQKEYGNPSKVESNNSKKKDFEEDKGVEW